MADKRKLKVNDELFVVYRGLYEREPHSICCVVSRVGRKYFSISRCDNANQHTLDLYIDSWVLRDDAGYQFKLYENEQEYLDTLKHGDIRSIISDSLSALSLSKLEKILKIIEEDVL